MTTRSRKAKCSVSNACWFELLFRVVVFCSFLLAMTLHEASGQQMGQDGRAEIEHVVRKFQEEFNENPRDSVARVHLAWALLSAGMMNDEVAKLMMSSFNAKVVDVPLHESPHHLKAFLAAHFLGRYIHEQKNYPIALSLSELAYRISSEEGVGETCTHMQLATLLNSYPLSHQAVDEAVERLEKWANHLIKLKTEQRHPGVELNVDFLQQIPGFDNDPYVHCVYTLFPLSFYYRADVAKIANLNYQISSLFFPDLLYTAEHVKEFEKEQREQRKLLGKDENSSGDGTNVQSSLPIIQKCVDRKIKFAVVCATLSENHSVSEDFGGVLQRLDRNIFEVSYHYIHEKSKPGEEAAFTKANPDDRLFHYHQRSDEKNNNGAWTRRIGKEIEEFQFDMIYYLDLTMSTITRRLAHSRLAPVQINSHGHPVTSGIPRDTVQYFVSWAEAELPVEESQKHYTEELQMIPKGKIHQYYIPRVQTSADGKRYTRVTNEGFDDITRKDFLKLPANIRNSSPDDEDIHLYVCMQKPFKLFPEFDELVCGILAEDSQGHAILHQETETGNTDVFMKRLKAAGCDMNRVHFLPPRPSHILMALYKTATVILDSYPAGGCTTSREAMELGKAIVTWPARLLGGRWTLGLYNIIGLDEDSKSRVIANSKEDYIAKAVELGTNKAVRQEVEKHILERVPHLFGRKEAVEEWEKIFLKISPVNQCKDTKTADKKTPDAGEL